MAIQGVAISDDAGVRALTSAAALADALANPTVAQLAVDNLLFNGTTWDRERGNWNTTTGDTGVKTATFNGATQTNYDARGAFIYIMFSTVSGTSPSCNVQLQWSMDGGSNWINFGPATSNAVATNTGIALLVYPTNFSSTPGATPAALTTNATFTTMINSPLPRTWRLLFTITGTTPSFSLTNVYVNYLK